MKIKIDYYDLGLTVERPDDFSCDELLEDFTRIMLMMGYHPDSIKTSIIELAEEYKDEDSCNK